jgi:excisionase family DNA binding protein
VTYLTIQDVQAKYRDKVSYGVIYSAIRKGEIEAYKPGKTYLLDPASVERWFQSKKFRPKKPVGRPRKYGASRREG